MKIKIESRHILEGKRKSPMACPIALSLMECLQDTAEHVVVGYSDNTVSVQEKGAEKFYRLIPNNPKLFRNFIRAFDNDFDMERFENLELKFEREN